jgi:hypothetical protein
MFDGSSILHYGSSVIRIGVMSGRNGQELLSTWVPAELAEAFKAQAHDAGAVAAPSGADETITAATGSRDQWVGIR